MVKVVYVQSDPKKIIVFENLILLHAGRLFSIALCPFLGSIILLSRNTLEYLFVMAICYGSHCCGIPCPTSGASKRLLAPHPHEQICPDVLGGVSGSWRWQLGGAVEDLGPGSCFYSC